MPRLDEIIEDLNLTIADAETLKIETANPMQHTEFTRAIGQLKAARTSLIGARRLESREVPHA